MFVVIGVGSIVNVIRVVTFLPIYGAKCMGYKNAHFNPPIIKNVVLVIILSIIAIETKISNNYKWLV